MCRKTTKELLAISRDLFDELNRVSNSNMKDRKNVAKMMRIVSRLNSIERVLNKTRRETFKWEI